MMMTLAKVETALRKALSSYSGHERAGLCSYVRTVT